MAKTDSEAVLEAPEAHPPSKKRGRGGQKHQNRPGSTQTPESPTFWQRQDRIAKADWGPRANIYLYRTEPITDRARSGNPNYIMKYAEPITEDRILADHGSGRYKLLLNFRKPGADQGDEVDSTYIEILNMQYPPRIPAGEWVDDPRNKRWAWAKKHLKEDPESRGGADPLETLQVLNEIRRDVREEMGPQADPAKTTLETLRLAKELFPAPAPPPPDTSMNAFMAFMQAELMGMRSQIEKSRDREIQLLEKLSSRDNPKPLSGVKEILGEFKEMFGIKDLKDVVTGAKEVGGAMQKSRMSGWQEFVVSVMPEASKIVQPIAGMFFSAMLARQQNPGALPAPATVSHGVSGLPAPSNGAASPGMMPFLQMVVMPLKNCVRQMGAPDNIEPETLGREFGAWVYEGFGNDPNFPAAMMQVKAMGAMGLIAALRSVPVIWNDKGPSGTLQSLAEIEPKLTPFFEAFLSFDPNEPESDDEPMESDPAHPGIIQTFSEGEESYS